MRARGGMSHKKIQIQDAVAPCPRSNASAVQPLGENNGWGGPGGMGEKETGGASAGKRLGTSRGLLGAIGRSPGTRGKHRLC